MMYPPNPAPTPPPPAGPWQWNNCNSGNMQCDTNLLLGAGCTVFFLAILVQQGVAAMHRRNLRWFTETAALMFLGAAFNALYLSLSRSVM